MTLQQVPYIMMRRVLGRNKLRSRVSESVGQRRERNVQKQTNRRRHRGRHELLPREYRSRYPPLLTGNYNDHNNYVKYPRGMHRKRVIQRFAYLYSYITPVVLHFSITMFRRSACVRTETPCTIVQNHRVPMHADIIAVGRLRGQELIIHNSQW